MMEQMQKSHHTEQVKKRRIRLRRFFIFAIIASILLLSIGAIVSIFLNDSILSTIFFSLIAGFGLLVAFLQWSFPPINQYDELKEPLVPPSLQESHSLTGLTTQSVVDLTYPNSLA